jgi:acetyl esterase/lipase
MTKPSTQDIFLSSSIDPVLLKQASHIYRDVAYACISPSQKLDIYLPQNGRKPYPVIVYFHGGAFAFGQKDDSSLEPALRGLEKGYAIVSASYRLSGEARFPAMVYDAKAVIRFIRASAGKYGFDPARIAAWGPSSGGWLVSMLGLTPGNQAFEDPSLGSEGFSASLNCVIDWCGPVAGFVSMDEDFRQSGLGKADHDESSSPESRFLGQRITSCPELCRLAAPITYVSREMPPFLIIHGGADQIVPVEQSLRFYEKIKAAAGADKVELFIAKGQKHHGAPWYQETWVSDICFAFLAKYMSDEKGN